MKKNKLIHSIILINMALISQAAYASDIDSVSVENKDMSEIRSEIAKRKLENEFYAEELNILQKKRNIEKVKEELYSSSTYSTDFKEKDLPQPFEEDLLSYELGNQSVGFVYQEDMIQKEEEINIDSILKDETLNSKIDLMIQDVISQKENDFQSVRLELEQKIRELSMKQEANLNFIQENEVFENIEDQVIKKILVNNFLQIGDSKKATIKIEYEKFLNNSPDGFNFKDIKISEGSVFDFYDDTYKVLELKKGTLKLLNIIENNEMVVKF